MRIEAVRELEEARQQYLKSQRYTDEEMSNAVLNAVRRHGPIRFEDLVAFIGNRFVDEVRSALHRLLSKDEISFDFRSAAYSFKKPETVQQVRVRDPVAITVKPSKDASVTIQLSPGLHRALKQYALTQHTSVEAEASHLLGEIIRTYQLAHVIPS